MRHSQRRRRRARSDVSRRRLLPGRLALGPRADPRRGHPVEVLKRSWDIYDTPVFQGTPGQAMHEGGAPIHARLDVPDDQLRFPMLAEMAADGGTDYFIMPIPMGGRFPFAWISFATDRTEGFRAADLAELGLLTRPPLTAGEQAIRGLAALREEHPEWPPLAMGVALHVGAVFYGNIGGKSRLGFTVIGPAVNEVCRVESLCKPLGTPLLMTANFAEAAQAEATVSLGHHRLRGVEAPQELRTLRRLLV